MLFLQKIKSLPTKKRLFPFFFPVWRSLLLPPDISDKISGKKGVNTVTQELMDWYDRHARTLPWRGIHNPYYTWVSEIMLQQTRVDTVIPYFNTFITVFPDIRSLAEAPEEKVLKCWEGLGYYSRARNLQSGAQKVLRDFGGILPSDPEKLITVPGIGRYTAGAIASIAYDKPVTAVDGNVIRVFTRFAGITEDASLPATLARVEALDRQYMDISRPGDWNQALMDLGATVCVPGTPDCDRCPLRETCVSAKNGDPEALPNLPDKKPPRALDFDVFLLCDGANVLMTQRAEKLLKDLWVFPMTEGHAEADQLPALLRRKWKIDGASPVFLGTAKHVFTHQIWQMRIWSVSLPELPSSGPLTVVPLSSLQTLAIPSAMKEPLRLLLQS